MHLHSVIISYNRLELTRASIASYLETVSGPYSLIVVDNGSEPKTTGWLVDSLPNLSPPNNPIDLILLGKNYYPGYACNRGWAQMPDETTHLHRGDNDFAYLPHWCQEVEKRFKANPNLGQLGLRTDREECFAPSNVGGNNVIKRQLWDLGLRYDEKPWSQYPPGWSEDTLLSPAVNKLGYRWERVKRSCIESLATEDWNDPYYAKSWGDRRIEKTPDGAPGTK